MGKVPELTLFISLCSAFKLLSHLFQMLIQRSLRAHEQEELLLFVCLFPCRLYLRLKLFISNDYLIFVRKLFQLVNKVGGIRHVYNENAVKQTDKEGKRKVV